MAETGPNVMGTMRHNITVADFGVITEGVWVAMVTPGMLSVDGFDVNPDACYMVKHNLMQNFIFTHEAKLISERGYDDPGSYEYRKLAAEDVVTPAMAREALGPHLERAVHLWEADNWKRGQGHAPGSPP